jgi:hypothetical protein
MRFSNALARVPAKEILRGHETKAGISQNWAKVVLRFLKEVPVALAFGADMKTCELLKIEDILSEPIENGRILVKQGLAEKVEADQA